MSYLTEEKLELCKELALAHNVEAGAIVLFSGESRKFNNKKEVNYLEYEAHPTLANRKIQEILEEAKKKWDLLYVKALHRIGKVFISDSAVLIITSSRHRKEAYESNSWIIDKIKHEVPIWKKEVYTDGSYEWVLQCHH